MINTKAVQARKDARPKELFEISGYKVLVEERNYITINTKNDKRHYFMSLEKALIDISDSLDKGNTQVELENLVAGLVGARNAFLKELREVIKVV